jgi:hypothetical protein
VEDVNPSGLANEVEQAYQYGAEVFEEQQEKVAKAVSDSMTMKYMLIMDGKRR